MPLEMRVVLSGGRMSRFQHLGHRPPGADFLAVRATLFYIRRVNLNSAAGRSMCRQ